MKQSFAIVLTRLTPLPGHPVLLAVLMTVLIANNGLCHWGMGFLPEEPEAVVGLLAACPNRSGDDIAGRRSIYNKVIDDPANLTIHGGQ